MDKIISEIASPMLANIDLSLARVSDLLAKLGNPQDKMPPVIHVAGTNGKGSLISYLTAIFEKAGYKVHRYISPPLLRFNERIVLAGEEISDEYLLSLIEEIKKADSPATVFEIITAIGFLAFSQTPADIVLLETGLGGRLDATNMIKNPILTAITPISIDHSEFLGDNIAAIAREKAGIIKPDVTCVLGEQSSAAIDAIEEIAAGRNAKIYRNAREWNAKTIVSFPHPNPLPEGEGSGGGFLYSSDQRPETLFAKPGLIGSHQINNTATAIACVDNLPEFNISKEDIDYGLKNAVWQARMQKLSSGKYANLLPPSCELWLDGGHNPAAGKIIADWVKEQKKPVHLVCAMLKTKDSREFLAPLADCVDSLTAIAIEGDASSRTPQELAAIASDLGIKSYVSGDLSSAIKATLQHNDGDFIVLICGSLYLASNVLCDRA